MKIWLFAILSLGIAVSTISAQERPGLFFREDWKEIPPATPVTQEHVSHSDLLVTRHGPGETGIRKSHHDRPADDPYYIWSGEAEGNWALSLRHQKSQIDLTGLAKIRWRSKQAGFRQLRIILKTANGQWLVSDQYDAASNDWRIREFNIADIRWRLLDIKKIVEGEWVNAPDLSRVEEVGFTDLMPGGRSVACSRLDWIEVYGRPAQKLEIPRNNVLQGVLTVHFRFRNPLESSHSWNRVVQLATAPFVVSRIPNPWPTPA